MSPRALSFSFLNPVTTAMATIMTASPRLIPKMAMFRMDREMLFRLSLLTISFLAMKISIFTKNDLLYVLKLIKFHIEVFAFQDFKYNIFGHCSLSTLVHRLCRGENRIEIYHTLAVCGNPVHFVRIIDPALLWEPLEVLCPDR